MLIYGIEYQEGKFIMKALINEIYLPPISNFSFFLNSISCDKYSEWYTRFGIICLWFKSKLSQQFKK